jgi:mRNA-degrading endonuclease RelE of RelBE toxin-antitoxin system
LRPPSVGLSKTSHEILRRLHPDIKRSIRKALDELSKNPYAGKPLKEELSGLWSLSVSHHRIIYQLETNTACGACVTDLPRFAPPRLPCFARFR